jgi:tripartite-type tricarboxylate transporter receptor subunit TctC
MMFDAVPTMTDFIRSGKVKAFGTTGDKRSVLPEVPTVSEAGVPGYEAVIWLGVMAPRNTPRDIVNRLNAEISKITSRPDVHDAWAKQGAVAMTMTPDAFARFMTSDIAKWDRIVKISGAKADQ